MNKNLKIIIGVIVIIVVLFSAFKVFGFKIYKYANNAISMHPTISPGDICLCTMDNKYNSKELKRGMIILLNHKNFKHYLTKRVIAKENDLFEIKNNKTYVNKKILEELYINIA